MKYAWMFWLVASPLAVAYLGWAVVRWSRVAERQVAADERWNDINEADLDADESV